MSGSRLDALLASDLLKKIHKKHGVNVLTRASDFHVRQVPRIPTGIFMWDYGLGGGLPAGRVSVVWGKKSSGKTTSLLKAVGNAQKMNANGWTHPNEDGKWDGEYREPIVAWIDSEGAWDGNWAQKMGVDTEKMLLSVPDYAEQSLDIGEGMLRSGEVDILVIDSIAFLVPSKEIEESVQKDLMGVQPRIVGKGTRKFVAAMNSMGNEFGRRPTVWFTNQVRMKLGVMFGSPETQPGGMAPGFAASTETRMWAGKYTMDDFMGSPVSALFNFKVEKNKTANAQIQGEWTLVLAETETKKPGDVKDEARILSMAEKVGLVEKVKGGWQCLGVKVGTKSMIERKMLLDSDFRNRVALARNNPQFPTQLAEKRIGHLLRSRHTIYPWNAVLDLFVPLVQDGTSAVQLLQDHLTRQR